MPLGSSISVSKLAATTGFDKRLLSLALRHAIVNDIFHEYEPDQISHSAASATLVETEKFCDLVMANSGYWTQNLHRWCDNKGIETTLGVAAAASDLSDIEKRISEKYYYFAGDIRAKYHKYLDGHSTRPRWSADDVAEAWPWASVGSGTVIDVRFARLSSTPSPNCFLS